MADTPTDSEADSLAARAAAAAEDPNRRPLKTRSWAFFGRVAARLAGAGVSPDAISIASIVFGVLACAAFVGTDRLASAEGVSVGERLLWLAAGVFIQLRLIANLLDGMVAIEGGKKSPVGPLYNEVPDRVADAAILLGAGWAAGGDPRWGAAATIVAVFVAYVRAMGTTVGVGQVFLGPMAKPHRMALLTAVCVACVFVPAAWRPETTGGLGLMAWALVIVTVGGLATAARRLSVISRRLREAASTSSDVGADE